MKISVAKRPSREAQAERLLGIADDLSRSLRWLRFSSPVTHVYNPLEYAREVYSAYVHRFGVATGRVIFVGMNPGPWGMAQTGVPFGEVGMVRDWMKLRGVVRKPLNEHPARLVAGFECLRSEVSGRRLWGWAKECFETPRRFFAKFFVANYCPLLFMEKSGRNLTPDKLIAREREAIENLCDEALRRTVVRLLPRHVIGIGNYAERCARRSLAGMDIPIGKILHPSPASPSSNNDWAATATKQLEKLGIPLPLA